MPEAVAVLLNAVENLGTEQRQAWQQCIERRFDFGFECSDEAFESSYSIAPAVLSRISGIGATLVVTVYSV